MVAGEGRERVAVIGTFNDVDNWRRGRMGLLSCDGGFPRRFGRSKFYAKSDGTINVAGSGGWTFIVSWLLGYRFLFHSKKRVHRCNESLVTTSFISLQKRRYYVKEGRRVAIHHRLKHWIFSSEGGALSRRGEMPDSRRGWVQHRLNAFRYSFDHVTSAQA